MGGKPEHLPSQGKHLDVTHGDPRQPQQPRTLDPSSRPSRPRGCPEVTYTYARHTIHNTRPDLQTARAVLASGGGRCARSALETGVASRYVTWTLSGVVEPVGGVRLRIEIAFSQTRDSVPIHPLRALDKMCAAHT